MYHVDGQNENTRQANVPSATIHTAGVVAARGCRATPTPPKADVAAPIPLWLNTARLPRKGSAPVPGTKAAMVAPTEAMALDTFEQNDCLGW